MKSIEEKAISLMKFVSCDAELNDDSYQKAADRVRAWMALENSTRAAISGNQSAAIAITELDKLNANG